MMSPQSVVKRMLSTTNTCKHKHMFTSLTRSSHSHRLSGSVFAKTKPRHGWTQAVFWGLWRSLFAPFHWDYWRQHTSRRLATYIMLHFLLQFIQAICFLVMDTETSNVSSKHYSPLPAAEIYVCFSTGLKPHLCLCVCPFRAFRATSLSHVCWLCAWESSTRTSPPVTAAVADSPWARSIPPRHRQDRWTAYRQSA